MTFDASVVHINDNKEITTQQQDKTTTQGQQRSPQKKAVPEHFCHMAHDQPWHSRSYTSLHHSYRLAAF
jgi:hypothetical protein